MPIKKIIKNNNLKTNPSNLIMFTGEGFNILGLKKHGLTTMHRKNFKPIQPRDQNQLLDFLIKIRGQIRPSQMKANECSQSNRCNP